MRNWLKGFLASSSCHLMVITAIIINIAIIIYDVDHSITTSDRAVMQIMSLTCLGIYIAELAVRLYAYKLQFFIKGWFIFDGLIVSAAILAYLPHCHHLHVLRVLLLLRLCEFMPSLKTLLEALIYALQGIMATLFLLTLIYIIYAVLGVQCFGHSAPQYFGSVSLSLKTLLQVMVFDNMGEVIDAITPRSSWGWVYILTFIFLTAYTFINLLLGVLLESLDHTAKLHHRQSILNHHTHMRQEITALKEYFLHLGDVPQKD